MSKHWECGVQAVSSGGRLPHPGLADGRLVTAGPCLYTLLVVSTMENWVQREIATSRASEHAGENSLASLEYVITFCVDTAPSRAVSLL